MTTTILAKSLVDEFHLNAHAHTPESWKAQLKTHGHSDIYHKGGQMGRQS